MGNRQSAVASHSWLHGLVVLVLASILIDWGFSNDREIKRNVLLILVDDLKPSLGCYGDDFAQTPNIDRLAKQGMRFDLAYCNQAVCAPSRFTLMLGSHSTSTGLYGLGTELRSVMPNAMTLPQHFHQYGYRTESLGKVFHIGHGNRGDASSFSVPHFHDKVIEYLDPASTDGGKLTREEAYFSNQKLGQIRSLPRGAAFESPEVNDMDYADGRVAAETIGRLQDAKLRYQNQKTPFFITVGFVRPHLPFSAPQKYWDRFDRDDIPLPRLESDPEDAPSVALKRGGEITNYKPVPAGEDFSLELKKNLIHGYYASASFVDAQVGKVLNELRRLELDEQTIVVLWGDHGFHLGDHGFWTKHTNYEQANRIPLLIRAPGVTRAGSVTRQLAESVDLFPTLADLCDLPLPTGPQSIDGLSLMPVLKDGRKRVRNHAFHAYPRRRMGRAIRTERYRLVEWKNSGDPLNDVQLELYDYQLDPHESKNIAEENPEVVNRLRSILQTYPPAVARANSQPGKKNSSLPSPLIANRSIKIAAEIQSGKPQGVVIAHGGQEQGYSLHFEKGVAMFDVRVNGKVIRVMGDQPVGGRISLEARLTKEDIQLSVNGVVVGKKRSGGWIPSEPKDGMTIGEDLRSAAGDYVPPNPFQGKILNTSVKSLSDRP